MGWKVSDTHSILSLWGRNMPGLLATGRGHLYQGVSTVWLLLTLGPPWNSKTLWGGQKIDPVTSFLPFSLKSLPPPQSPCDTKGLAAGERGFWRGGQPCQGKEIQRLERAPGIPIFLPLPPRDWFWRVLLCGGPARCSGGMGQGTRTQADWLCRGPGCLPGWGQSCLPWAELVLHSDY